MQSGKSYYQECLWWEAGVDPASNVRGAISVIFGSQFHNGFATVREMKYTSPHCSDKTMNDRMALYREQ